MSPKELQTILNLPTHRLLAYYKKHYRHHRNPYRSRYDDWLDTDEVAAEQWDIERETIRDELNTREHVK